MNDSVFDMGHDITLKFDLPVDSLKKGKKYFCTLLYDHNLYKSKIVYLTSMDCVVFKEKDRYLIFSKQDSAKLFIVANNNGISNISAPKTAYFK